MKLFFINPAKRRRIMKRAWNWLKLALLFAVQFAAGVLLALFLWTMLFSWQAHLVGALLTGSLLFLEAFAHPSLLHKQAPEYWRLELVAAAAGGITFICANVLWHARIL